MLNEPQDVPITLPEGWQERVALVGPTASGKTAVGVCLARLLGGEIVSADSMQVYRRMEIGTAKPTAAERQQAVFHGVDAADPDDEWTLADYQSFGEAACLDIHTRGQTPLIVGGTGLYVRALTTRLEIPAVPPDEAFRTKWREFAKTNGNDALLAEVAKADPDTAARLHVNDVGRQIRALEVYAVTGRTLTELHRDNQARMPKSSPHLFGLTFADREALYQRIDARVDAMLAEGLVDEVRELISAGYAPTLKPMQALGYKQICAFLAADLDLLAATALIKQETRRFAKRQLIWFRGDPRVQWIEAGGKTPEQLAEQISQRLSEHPKGALVDL